MLVRMVMRLWGSGLRSMASPRFIPSHWIGGALCVDVMALVVALDAARRPGMLNVSPPVLPLLLLDAAIGGCATGAAPSNDEKSKPPTAGGGAAAEAGGAVR